MYIYHARTPADKKRQILKRSGKQLRKLAKQKEECLQEIRREKDIEREAQVVAMEQDVMSRLNSGDLRIRDLLVGIDIHELARSYDSGAKLSGVVSAFAIPALLAVAQSLDSSDERSKLVAAKIILDAASGKDKQVDEVRAGADKEYPHTQAFLESLPGA